MKYFSLFTGIGGLDMGLEERGHQCIGFSEIKNTSIAIYKQHYPDHINYGDLTKIDYKSLPDFDILTGGFPCQSFSLAGLRKGFDDTKGKKGQMIFYIYDLIMAKKPKYLVLENVKGIYNHDGGETFKKVIKLLSSAGYYTRAVLLNSLYYGSAQNRERVIFIASLQDFPEITPIIKDDTKRFRDIRDHSGNYRWVKETGKNKDKLEQKLQFNFELIGGYDRVGTLTTQQGCGEKAVYEEKEDKYRLLTPLECERLQGFPDHWTSGVKDNGRYFALGNAVNCNVSRYLFLDYLPKVWEI